MSTFRLKHTDHIVAAFLLSVAAVLAVSVFLVVRNHNMWKRRFTYKTVFDDGGGIKPETPVRIAGIEVGSVRSVTLTGNDKVEVTFDVLEEYSDRLRSDPPDGSCGRSKVSVIDSEEQRNAARAAQRNCGSRVAASVPAGLGAFLPTSGLIIQVGNRKNPVVAPGDYVPADETEDLGDLIARLQQEGTVQNVRDIVVQMDALLKNINDPAGPIQQTLHAVAEVSGRAAEGKGLLGEVTREDTPIQRQVTASLQKLDSALGHVERAATDVQQIAASVAGRGDEIENLISRLAAFSEDARRIGQDLAEIAEDTRGLPTDVRDAVSNLNGRIDDMGLILDGLKTSFPLNMVVDDTQKGPRKGVAEPTPSKLPSRSTSEPGAAQDQDPNAQGPQLEAPKAQ